MRAAQAPASLNLGQVKGNLAAEQVAGQALFLARLRMQDPPGFVVQHCLVDRFVERSAGKSGGSAFSKGIRAADLHKNLEA